MTKFSAIFAVLSQLFPLLQRLIALAAAADSPQVVNSTGDRELLLPSRGHSQVIEDIKLGLDQARTAYESATEVYKGASTVLNRISRK